MTMGDQVTVTMTGGGPYGFRLFGGENIPLSVAKIRRRSKAADAGLIEGDILLGINGYSCSGVNHSTAMSLAESSGDMLVFQLLRGADDQQSVEAAFRSLGDQLSSISPSALQASAAPPAGRPMINSNVTPASQYHRQERTIQDADSTTRVTTETRTDTLGDSSYRQTTTQRLTTSKYGSVSPRRAVSPLQPLGHAQRNPTQSSMRVISAPSGMNVQQNRDHSVTMTIGVPAEHKENVAPQPVVPMFKVSKVTDSQSNGIWTPGSGGMSSRPAPRPAPQRSPSPRFNVQQKWQPPPPSKLAAPPRASPRAPSPVQPEPTQMTFTVDLGQDVAITPSDFRSSQHEMDGEPPLPVDIQKLMYGTHGGDSQRSTPDSPATLARKKKIYADSSFYDDPEHKYPTIEEQIKMARSVALSLMAPQNKRARGHTMFMKRREGASRWVAGVEPEPYDHVDTGPSTEEGEKYYRPAPWKAGDQTWRPVGAPKPYIPPQQQYQPPPQQMQQQPQQPAPEPYERGWGQPDISARTWGRSAEPVYGQQPQQQQQQQQQQPPQQQLQPAPAYGPVRSPARGPAPPPASSAEPASAKPFHTWQPSSYQPAPPQEPPSWGQSATPTQQPAWEPAPSAPPPAPPAQVAAPPPPPPPPPAPPLPDDSVKTMWRTPQLPSMKDHKDRLNALSYDEFEKVRLLDSKNLHNTVSPQMCFDLSNDLRNMKGKGGKLFAKRRARAEQWVVDEHPTNKGPDKNVMEKIAGQVAMEQARQSANLKTQPQLKSNDASIAPMARLQEMIAKPAMSPWEAAAGGNIDAAFSHINKRNTIHGDNIISGGWKNPTPPSGPGPAPSTSLLALSGQAPTSSTPRNDYTRKIKGWSSVGAPAPAPSSMGNVKPVSAPSFNAKQSYGGSNTLAPSPRPQHLSQERTPSPRLSAPSPRQELTSPCYQTPPQRQSPQPPVAMQPATNGEVFYDAPEQPVGCGDGGGFSDM